jgi:hypothetical protein
MTKEGSGAAASAIALSAVCPLRLRLVLLPPHSTLRSPANRP